MHGKTTIKIRQCLFVSVAQKMYNIQIIISECGKCAYSDRSHVKFLHKVALFLTSTKRIQMFYNTRNVPCLHAVKSKQIMSKIYKPYIERSRYSTRLRAGWPGVRISSRQKFFSKPPRPALGNIRPLIKWVKGKAIPLQAWTGPGGYRRLRLTEFKIIGI
jgi:hypothetical protein